MADGSLPPPPGPPPALTRPSASLAPIPFPLRPRDVARLAGHEPPRPVRSCVGCGCTEAQACPGGCAWAIGDYCTACVGHTPASWSAFRCEPILEEARPVHLCLVEAIGHGAQANAVLGDALTGRRRALSLGEVIDEAIAQHAHAIGDLVDAAGVGGRYVPLAAALLRFLEERT